VLRIGIDNSCKERGRKRLPLIGVCYGNHFMEEEEMIFTG